MSNHPANHHDSPAARDRHWRTAFLLLQCSKQRNRNWSARRIFLTILEKASISAGNHRPGVGHSAWHAISIDLILPTWTYIRRQPIVSSVLITTLLRADILTGKLVRVCPQLRTASIERAPWYHTRAHVRQTYRSAIAGGICCKFAWSVLDVRAEGSRSRWRRSRKQGPNPKLLSEWMSMRRIHDPSIYSDTSLQPNDDDAAAKTYVYALPLPLPFSVALHYCTHLNLVSVCVVHWFCMTLCVWGCRSRLFGVNNMLFDLIYYIRFTM
jgi:hypothetical protein